MLLKCKNIAFRTRLRDALCEKSADRITNRMDVKIKSIKMGQELQDD